MPTHKCVPISKYKYGRADQIMILAIKPMKKMMKNMTMMVVMRIMKIGNDIVRLNIVGKLIEPDCVHSQIAMCWM